MFCFVHKIKFVAVNILDAQAESAYFSLKDSPSVNRNSFQGLPRVQIMKCCLWSMNVA